MSGYVTVRLQLSVTQYTAMLRALHLHGNTTNKIAKRIERNINRQQQRKSAKESKPCA